MEKEEDRGFKPSKRLLHSPPNVILFISLLLMRGPTVQCRVCRQQMSSGFGHHPALRAEFRAFSTLPRDLSSVKFGILSSHSP